MLLEIVSGRKNRNTPTLLSDVSTLLTEILEDVFFSFLEWTSITFNALQAWESWNQHRITELLDSAVAQPEPELLFELDRCVQIGLLCVQQSPNDRPTICAVVTMLNNSSSQIRAPKRLVFDAMTEPRLREADHSAKEGASSTSNGSHTIYLS
jgi:hypothetical protein